MIEGQALLNIAKRLIKHPASLLLRLTVCNAIEIELPRRIAAASAVDHTSILKIEKERTPVFQRRTDAVGAENIALGLESNLTRVAELIKGERFTPETAFHMETTLGLPHGFFDQSNPVLAPETIARLRSPLDFVQRDTEPEVVSETFKLTSASKVNQQPFLKDRQPAKSRKRPQSRARQSLTWSSLPEAPEQLTGAAAPLLHPMTRPSTSVTSLENLEGIEPIAEALIKTLAGKARTGQLDELKALELLQQAVLL